MRRERLNRYFIKNLNISTGAILVDPVLRDWGIFASSELTDERLKTAEKLEVVKTPFGLMYKLGEFYYKFKTVHAGISVLLTLAYNGDLEILVKEGKKTGNKKSMDLLIIKCGGLCLAVAGYHHSEIFD